MAKEEGKFAKKKTSSPMFLFIGLRQTSKLCNGLVFFLPQRRTLFLDLWRIRTGPQNKRKEHTLLSRAVGNLKHLSALPCAVAFPRASIQLQLMADLNTTTHSFRLYFMCDNRPITEYLEVEDAYGFITSTYIL